MFLFFSGRLTCGAEPVTDPSSKLYMPKYLYPGRRYPGYLSGTAYLLSGKIIPTLLQNSLSTRLIHIEDIYITGILAKKSNIYPEDSIYFTYLRVDPKNTCLLKQMVRPQFGRIVM
jgi:beta-1,3-galactosyltransferase 1